MTEDSDRDRNRGLIGAIQGIVEALAEADREDRDEFSGTGRLPKGHFTANYGYSGRFAGSDSETDSDSEASGSRSSSSTRETDEYLVDVRYDEDDDEMLVVADLPDVDADELTVGIDRDTDELVIGIENRPLERVELPWPVAEADAQYHHGVLELRFTPAEDRA